MEFDQELWNATVRHGTDVEIARYMLKCWAPEKNLAYHGALYQYDLREHTWNQRTNNSCVKDILELDGYQYAKLGDTQGSQPEIKYVRMTSTRAKRVFEAAQVMKLERVFEHEPQFFDDTPHGVLCNDVFLCAKGAQICAEPCKPIHKQRAKLRIAYAPDAHAPMWEKALEDWFGFDDDGMRKRALLGEFVGAALFGLATRYQKAMFLYAAGGNGKSQLLDVVESLFPKQFLGAVSPQTWSNEYNRDQLSRIRLNIVNEIPSRSIDEGAYFKAIITGDPINARKIYGVPYTYRPRAAHMFSTNEIPTSKDTSDGFWRRLLVLTMDKRFDGTPQEIPELAQKIIAHEQEGVLAWAVEGARRLLQQDAYTIPESSRRAVEQWRGLSDPLGAWLKSRTTSTNKSHEMALAKNLFADWLQWSGDGENFATQTVFSKALKKRLQGSKRFTNGVRYPVKLR